jgi:hypothetical protein
VEKKDIKKRQAVSDADLQEMLDNGEIFGSEDTDFSTNYEAYEMARQAVGQIRGCDCGNVGPHMHVAIKRPEGSTLSDAEFQAIAQRHFNDALKKKLGEKQQEEKRRKRLGEK